MVAGMFTHAFERPGMWMARLDSLPTDTLFSVRDLYDDPSDIRRYRLLVASAVKHGLVTRVRRDRYIITEGQRMFIDSHIRDAIEWLERHPGYREALNDEELLFVERWGSRW